MKTIFLLFTLAIMAGLSSCKKEDCKNCKTITLHFMQGQAEKYGRTTDTTNTAVYDTTFSTECNSVSIPNRTPVSWTKDSSIKKGAILQVPEKNWVCPADTTITFVYTGTRFCD